MGAAVALGLFRASLAFAEPGDPDEAPVETPVETPAEAPAAPPPSPPPTALPEAKLKVDPLGYVEAYYQYNLNRPSNGITSYRGFDNRHNTFSLTNAALGAAWSYARVAGKLILQVGPTGASYYSSEPVKPGAGGANATGPELWRYIQEATVGYDVPAGRGLRVEAGIRPSPIGFEAFAIKDHWTWSRSNLFFGLPYYHAGIRAEYSFTDAITSSLAVFNGWNNVVDNNEAKSVVADVAYKVNDAFKVRLLYFGGVERSTGSPEGPYWRHHFDGTFEWKIARWLSSAGQVDYGFEPNRFGTARWWAAAVAARVRICEHLFFVYRGDRFHEHLATGERPGQSSTPLFWGGSEWVTSSTTTLDLRPVDHVSIRLEHRLDVAEAPIYFRGDVTGDGSSAAPYVANARGQETITLGATTWF